VEEQSQKLNEELQISNEIAADEHRQRRDLEEVNLRLKEE